MLVYKSLRVLGQRTPLTVFLCLLVAVPDFQTQHRVAAFNYLCSKKAGTNLQEMYNVEQPLTTF